MWFASLSNVDNFHVACLKHIHFATCYENRYYISEIHEEFHNYRLTVSLQKQSSKFIDDYSSINSNNNLPIRLAFWRHVPLFLNVLVLTTGNTYHEYVSIGKRCSQYENALLPVSTKWKYGNALIKRICLPATGVTILNKLSLSIACTNSCRSISTLNILKIQLRILNKRIKRTLLWCVMIMMMISWS